MEYLSYFMDMFYLEYSTYVEIYTFVQQKVNTGRSKVKEQDQHLALPDFFLFVMLHIVAMHFWECTVQNFQDNLVSC